jgi:hypothetical protein
MDTSRSTVRIGLTVILLLTIVPVANAYLANTGTAVEDRTVAPRDDVTVVTTQWKENDRNMLVAFGPSGDVIYHNNTYDGYWDVDPSPAGNRTVRYSATRELRSACPGSSVCTLNIVERANLTTGEVTTVYERMRPGHFNNEWHDVDRYGPNRILIADMDNNEVRLVNTSTEMIEWVWDAQRYLDVNTGGSAYFKTSYPEDWTHLNDVEVLADGRVMVSLRNHDQVVFIDPEEGVEQDWTLGEDDAHSIVNEQHNPDYIPPEDGGPAVVVSDSHNDRIVEYQRENGSWTRSWEWSDETMNWPRDGDRLPNGHTLVTDTNGDRVFEVDTAGDVVWTADVEGPYEAERLGTGPESANGPSAERANLTSQTAANATKGYGLGPTRLALVIKNSLPSSVVNAVLYVIPPWMDARGLFSLILFVVVGLAWAIVELRWSDIEVTVRNPIDIRR